MASANAEQRDMIAETFPNIALQLAEDLMENLQKFNDMNSSMQMGSPAVRRIFLVRFAGELHAWPF